MDENEILPERLSTDQLTASYRPLNPGAEKWLYRPIPCLDHGFVYLVDYMGNDHAIAEAARVSYGAGTKQVSGDRILLRHLRRHLHTSPSEMVEFKFHCKMPIFVARQWIRHRTANVNEYSARFSELLDEFYMPSPEVLRKQSQTNKQGRDEELTPRQQNLVLKLLKEDYERSYRNYREFLGMDLARELARIGLGVGFYTQWYWKIDLHNLLHFLRLRLDPHAQYEIRVYGEAMAKIVKDAVPIMYEAFEDYQLYAMSLSRLEIDFLRENSPETLMGVEKEILLRHLTMRFGNKREAEELLEKLERLGMVKK